MIGIRDATQIAMFDRGEKPVMDLRGAVLIHTAPERPQARRRTLREGLHRHDDECPHEPLHARASSRDYGVRAIIGKGGLLADSLPVLQEFGGVYLAITGGAAALETTQIEEIEDVEFEELLPECLWKFRVQRLRPADRGDGRPRQEPLRDGHRAGARQARRAGRATLGGAALAVARRYACARVVRKRRNAKGAQCRSARP